ncbi:MAG: ABC transporter permease, partial [Rhodobacteraceae bacterium]|nr:ABC transporter permease [Paracoccaceae bacterium]
LGYLAGGIMRGLLVALAIGSGLALVLGIIPQHPFLVLLYVIIGSVFLGGLGIVAAIYATRFDQLAAISNFVITPLAFLSGTFYSVQSLPPVLNAITHVNPIFYLIDGVRFGMIGVSDSSVTLGLAVTSCSALAVGLVAWWMLKTGYRIKA